MDWRQIKAIASSLITCKIDSLICKYTLNYILNSMCATFLITCDKVDLVIVAISCHYPHYSRLLPIEQANVKSSWEK